jgi:hypothetical protein
MRFIKKYLMLLVSISVLLILICFALLLIPESHLPAILQNSGLAAIISAFLGVFMTVAVTAVLLEKQVESEESKEQRVRVFKARKKKYDKFINKLWDNREKWRVELEDVDELLKMLSKDIILYTKPETVEQILSYLKQMAECASREGSNNTPESLREIQENMFGIINALAKEIGLGGEINESVRKKLNDLEDKLFPCIKQKKYIKTIKELVFFKINLTQFKFEPDEISKEKNVLWWHIDKGMWLRVGDGWKNGKTQIGFCSDFFENRQYQKYRYRIKGEEKNWMKAYTPPDESIMNFNDFRDGKPLPEDCLGKLANEIEEFYMKKHADFGNRTILELIDECNKNFNQ